MRIIRGRFKTRRYTFPKSFPSRPTTDFAKEGLFNILENKLEADDLKILDLCTGTGNIAMEFISREWGKVVAVDKNYNCIKHLQKVINDYDCKKDLRVIKADILSFVNRTEERFDLIFADPPYLYEHYSELIETIFMRNLLNNDGLLIVEHGKKTSLADITQFDIQRTYGNVCFSFFTSK